MDVRAFSVAWIPAFAVHWIKNGGKQARAGQYLGYADGLLFHRFVNRNLVFNVHLIKLVNAAHTVGGVSEAKCNWYVVLQGLNRLQPHDKKQKHRKTSTNWKNANLLSASISAPASMPNSPVSLSFTTLAVRPAADEACAPKSSEVLQRRADNAAKSQLKPERERERDFLAHIIELYLAARINRPWTEIRHIPVTNISALCSRPLKCRVRHQARWNCEYNAEDFCGTSNVLQELAFCGGRIAHDAYVDVTTQLDPVFGHLANSAKHLRDTRQVSSSSSSSKCNLQNLKGDAALNVISAVNRGAHALNHVLCNGRKLV
jgi:hypothetical protein